MKYSRLENDKRTGKKGGKHAMMGEIKIKGETLKERKQMR